MKRILSILALLVLAASAHADSSYPSTSIYQLEAKLENQAGVKHGLDVYEGHPVLVTMFYSSCGHTCPLLIDTMRTIERTLPDAKNLRVLLISFDPERDTQTVLAKLAKDRRIDTSRWTLARGDAATARKIAAVLNIQYKQLPDGEFNHSNVITVLKPNGEIAAQSSSLGKADAALIKALRQWAQ